MGEISTYFQRVRVNTREVVIANDESEDILILQTELKHTVILSISSEKDLKQQLYSDNMKEAWRDFTTTRVEYGKDLDKLV
jgi:hypothetical protein